ncbi:hypothetical protein CEXT_175441 [Caerostris extrusa]|uniref:Uncharacterized protein n=1 Tax=Caerostris extrusa TaxID=172846 RepID=A0AAV4NI30_CAEEX|nr:hypothetical protein CEXT_175441 [Caerostris extrusa]
MDDSPPPRKHLMKEFYLLRLFFEPNGKAFWSMDSVYLSTMLVQILHDPSSAELQGTYTDASFAVIPAGKKEKTRSGHRYAWQITIPDPDTVESVQANQFGCDTAEP